MKLNRELLIGLGLFGSLAALILVLNRAKQPEDIILDMSRETPVSEEHQLVEQALNAPERLSSFNQLNHSEELRIPEGSATPSQQPQLEMVYTERAPDMEDVELSPSLERSLAASSSLGTNDFIDPESELNRSQVESLRTIRRNRE